MPIVHLKLKPHAEPDSKQELLDKTSKRRGVKSVKALFPNHKNERLANMYSIETADDDGSLLKALRKDITVEYAEEAATRKPL